MSRSQPRIYTNVMSRPLKHALKYFDIERMRTVIEVRTSFTYPDLIANLLLHLKEFQPDVLEKAAAIDDERFMSSKHKERRYIARERNLLYINSPHLTEKHSRAVDDHWMITNMGRPETYSLLSTITSASGLKREPFAELKV
jgi:hypothetical protein